MNYQQKSEEVFTELFHENWMTQTDWNTFKSRASKIYSVKDLAEDLEAGFPSTSIDSKINEIRKKIKI